MADRATIVRRWRWTLALLCLLCGCEDHGARQTTKPAVSEQGSASARAKPQAVAPTDPRWQRGQGLPYELLGTQVWDVPDPVSGRDYQVFVSLPASYDDRPQREYPVLYVTDADYAFPVARQIARRLNGEGARVQDFILVGLSYAKGETGMSSRRRDYTPTPAGSPGAPPEAVHGGAEAYIAYVRDQVLGFIEGRYRTASDRRIFLGHSYGGLLGTQIMLTEPTMFSAYILGSPSYWYDQHAMAKLEKAYARQHDDLPAKVYMYVGQYEQVRYGKQYDMVTDARAMTAALSSHGYRSLGLKLEVLDDEDHLSIAPRGMTHGLLQMLAADPP